MIRLFKGNKVTNQVKFLREKNGMTLKELAERVENNSRETVSWQMIKAIEEYRYMPSFTLAKKIAKALNEELEIVFF